MSSAAMRRVEALLADYFTPDSTGSIEIHGDARLAVRDLRAVLALAQRADEHERRAKLATRYLKCVSSGQFVTASLVVAAIRALDMREALPLTPRGRAKGRRVGDE